MTPNGGRGPAGPSIRKEHVRLGFAVKVLGEGGLPSHDARRWQSEPHLRDSLVALRDILEYLAKHEISMYRFTASLAPYATHPDLPQFHGQVEACAEELADVGALAREHDIRLSSHPGQYIVLNSENPDVQAGSIRDLEVQAALMDAMGLGDALGRFEDGLDRLSDAARRRLVIENDDRTFGLGAVLELHRRTGLRVVWDILHHHCHDPEGIPDREALEAALATWPADVTPKIHYSTPKTALEERKRKVGRKTVTEWVLPQLRAHADLIDPIAFSQFLTEVEGVREFDVMLEAKGKDLALLRLREQLKRETAASRRS
jgi:UV DNA damage endonuclease